MGTYWTVDKRHYKRERDWGITISGVILFIMCLLAVIAVTAYVMMMTMPIQKTQTNYFYRTAP